MPWFPPKIAWPFTCYCEKMEMRNDGGESTCVAGGKGIVSWTSVMGGGNMTRAPADWPYIREKN